MAASGVYKKAIKKKMLGEKINLQILTSRYNFS